MAPLLVLPDQTQRTYALGATCFGHAGSGVIQELLTNHRRQTAFCSTDMHDISYNRWAFGLRFVALLSVALCLVPTGAHLAEFATKMAMPQSDYMVVQQIYAGWALFGIPVIAALAATLAQALTSRMGRADVVLALAALVCLAATQAIFWAFTYPMNVASRNWTVSPPDFENARRQWEYSHAASGVLTLCAFALLLTAAARLASRR